MIKERSSNGNESCTETCMHPEWKGNGWCEDENNNCGCDWDGGDCCGYDIAYMQSYNCEHQECECLDPNFVEPDWNSCGEPWWWKDGMCDDENNNSGCQWDGGDCDSNDTGPEKDTTTILPNSCEHPHWINDGYCDDENNNSGCEWDGADCCGDNVNTRYCTECACLDPNYQKR